MQAELEDVLEEIGTQAWEDYGGAPVNCQYGPCMEVWAIGMELLLEKYNLVEK